MNLPERRKWLDHTFARVMLFALTRALALFLAISVSLSLTILVTSRSGVLESEIKGSRIKGWLSGPSRVELPTVTPELDETASPFVNFVSLLVDGLTFNFTEGPIFAYYFIDTTNNPLQLVLDSLTRTVALFGTASLLVFALLLVYHWKIQQGEQRQVARAHSRKYALFPVLILVPETLQTDQTPPVDFGATLAVALEREMPGLPIAMHVYTSGAPDETLSAAKAVITKFWVSSLLNHLSSVWFIVYH